jgi:hypothetical protein
MAAWGFWCDQRECGWPRCYTSIVSHLSHGGKNRLPECSFFWRARWEKRGLREGEKERGRTRWQMSELSLKDAVGTLSSPLLSSLLSPLFSLLSSLSSLLSPSYLLLSIFSPEAQRLASASSLSSSSSWPRWPRLGRPRQAPDDT